LAVAAAAVATQEPVQVPLAELHLLLQVPKQLRRVLLVVEVGEVGITPVLEALAAVGQVAI
jgi:hypothetical protein